MGILAEPAQFIRDLKLSPGFSVCELGDQMITHVSPHYPAEEFYRSLGCGRYVSIDGNGRGTHLFDLNKPLPISLGMFDVVTDFGTSEHIFNQGQVWRTIHALIRINGYFVFDRPIQGYPEHGFYLFQECVYRDVAACNEYRILRLERMKTKRGELIRGVMQRLRWGGFRTPQQGRYRGDLAI